MRQLLAAIAWGAFMTMVFLMYLGTLPVTAGRIVAIVVMLLVAMGASVTRDN